MKLRLEEKRKAILLRRKGYSYNEIRNVIPNLSKGTISGWLKNIELRPEHRERIINKIHSAGEKGRLRGAWINKKKALDRIDLIQKQAKKEFNNLLADPLSVCAISLYWAEGSKKSRRFQFMNSDPKMIMVMLKWLRKMGILNDQIKIRIYAHKVYEKENPEKLWLKITGLPAENLLKTIYKPAIHLVKKNLNYIGCCRIEVTGSELYWKMVKWQEMIASKI